MDDSSFFVWSFAVFLIGLIVSLLRYEKWVALVWAALCFILYVDLRKRMRKDRKSNIKTYRAMAKRERDRKDKLKRYRAMAKREKEDKEMAVYEKKYGKI